MSRPCRTRESHLRAPRAAVCRHGVVLAAIAATAGCAGDDVRFGETIAASRATSVGTAPMFAVSSAGREAIAWVSSPDSGTDGRVYVSMDGAPPAELRDSLGPIEAHGESPPKLAFGPDGSLNAIYVVAKVVPGRRFPAAALRFVRSKDDGGSWSAPVTVTDDSVFGSHNFHSLHVTADGLVYVGWLDGRHGKSAAYAARSADGGKTWSRNQRVSRDEACPCCRTSIASAPDGTIYMAWRTVMPGNIRDVVVSRSTDSGVTWTDPVRVKADDWVFPGCPHAGPALQLDSAGAVHVAWWTGKEGVAGVYYARSDDGARTFAAPVPLSTAVYYPAAHVQLATGANGVVAVAWDDARQQPARVTLRVTRDGGKTFGAQTLVSDGSAAAGFPVLAIVRDTVIVAWSALRSDAERSDQHVGLYGEGQDTLARLHPVGAAQVLVRRGALR